MKHTVNAGVHRADSGRRPVSGTMSFKRAVARAFDTSSTMKVCSAFCRGLLRLRLRVIGVALLTFGVYSAVVAVISGAVSGELSFSNVYFGVGAALLSVPLLLSGGNVSSALLGSGTGKVIRRFLCLRSESVTDYTSRSISRYGDDICESAACCGHCACYAADGSSPVFSGKRNSTFCVPAALWKQTCSGISHMRVGCFVLC